MVETVTLDEILADPSSGVSYTPLREASTYDRPPARLVNPEVAHPAARNRYLVNPTGRTPPEGVVVFRDATVSNGACIHLADGRVLAESLDRGMPPPVTGEPPERTLPRAVFPAKHGNANYGHFLVEILPRLVLDREAYPERAPILLRRWSRRFCLPMLEAVGFGDRRYRWCRRAPVAVETLYWPTRNTFAPLDVSPHVFEVFRALVEQLGGEPEGRRIFLGRGDAPTRQLVDEDAVLGALEPLGFERVLPGRMPFADQVRTFSETGVVVAVSGAALTNLVFMPPGGSIVMLTPASMAGLLFWELAGHADLDFTVLWGEVTESESTDKHADFTLDPGLVAEVVADVLRSR